MLEEFVGAEDDLTFESTRVRVSVAEESSFVVLFSSANSMGNGWKIVDYIDLL